MVSDSGALIVDGTEEKTRENNQASLRKDRAGAL
jgi:hypothetical protein